MVGELLNKSSIAMSSVHAAKCYFVIFTIKLCLYVERNLGILQKIQEKKEKWLLRFIMRVLQEADKNKVIVC